MRIYVNGEERNLHVYDKIAGVDYAKNVICAQDRLDTDDFGAFTMTEEEFEYWRKLLVTLQDSEDIRFAIKDLVDEEELSDYVYEETKYVTQTQQIIEVENLSLKELQKALTEKNMAWLKENGFVKTLEK